MSYSEAQKEKLRDRLIRVDMRKCKPWQIIKGRTHKRAKKTDKNFPFAAIASVG